jgi:Zn-dependent M28 family amino/carboxypeptidase
VKKIQLTLLVAMGATMAACSGEKAPQVEVSPDAADASTSAAVIEAAGGNPAAEQASLQISDDYMRGIVVEISDDSYEGRGPGSRGDEAARKYLAGRMEELGLLPGGEDGSWEQPFDLVGVNTTQPGTWTFDGQDKSMTLKQWDQFIVGSGVQETRAGFSDAEVVFVGYGIQAPEYDWDDYKGVDLEGKILLMMNNDPDWDSELFGGETRLWYGRWDYKYLSAARQGAAGAIIIHTSPSAGYPWQVVQTSWTGVQFELPAGEEPRSQVNAWLTEDSARDLVAMAGLDLDELREAAYNRDFEPVSLGVKTSLTMDVDIQRTQSANVLGLIPGSDPILKDEVVVYTAHHDHLGIGTPNEDGVNLVGAEEQGLLGSEYYAANPTFPPGKIAANLNYDGGNIWGHTHDVTFVGLGKSTVDEIVTLIAGEQGRVVKPDQFADKGYFYRSDQFSFAKIGVPAMYLDTGTDFVDRPPEWGREQQEHYTEVNYHQPTDEYSPSWTFEGMIDDALLGFWTGLAIANADEKPTWNPGDEFEAARIEALQALEE